MKYKSQISVLLVLVMLFSTLISVAGIPVVSADVSQPLELVSMSPEHNGSQGGTQGEISLAFNQPVEIFTSQMGFEAAIAYDEDGQGVPNAPIDGNSFFVNILEVSSENPNKVIVNINDLLKEGHIYSVMLTSCIRVAGSTKTSADTSDDVYPMLMMDGMGWLFSITNQGAELNSIEITGEETVAVGESIALSANTKDEQGNSIEENVTWTSSDETVATVDEKGEVTGVKAGEATITATSTTNTDIRGTKDIIVEAPALELVSMSPEHNGIVDKIQDEISLTFNQPVEIFTSQMGFEAAIAYDEDGQGVPNAPIDGNSFFVNILEVSSENPNKVIVNINDVLKGEHIYSVMIISCIRVEGSTQTSSDTSDEVYPILMMDGMGWVFTVNKQNYVVTSIEINGNSIVEVENKISLSADVKDEQGNSIEESVTWTSSDETVATVDEKGEVTGVKAGEVAITATSVTNTDISANITITVEDPLDYDLIVKQQMQLSSQKNVDVHGIRMNNGIVYALVGDEHQVTTKLYAYDLYGHLLWNTELDERSSKNPAYVPSFDEQGNIYLQYSVQSKTLVYSVSPQGSINWKKEIEEKSIGGNVTIEPLISDGQVIVAVKKGMYSLSAVSGDVIWHNDINIEGLAFEGDRYQIESTPIIRGNRIYVTIQGENTATTDGKIQVYDLDGIEQWSYISDKGILDPAIGYGSTVYVADKKGKIAALAPGDGSVFTSDPLNGFTIDDPENIYSCNTLTIGSDKTLYCSYELPDEVDSNISGDGRFIAINSNGTQKYDIEFNNTLRQLVTDDEEYFYHTKANSEGRSTIYALDPYGNVAGSIPGYDSTVTGYFNIDIQGNVLLGSRSVYGQWIAAKIQYDTLEVPGTVDFITPDKTLGVNLEESLPVVVKNDSEQVMIADELEWSSSNTSVLAVVDGIKGTFKGIKAGIAQVTVKVKDHPEVTKTLTVNIEEKQSVPTSVEILSKEGNVVDNTIEVKYQKPYLFTYTIKDQYGEMMEEETAYWLTSLNLESVFVDQDGLFHPSATGVYPLAAVSNEDVNVRKDITVNIKKEASEFGGILPKEIVLTLPGSVQLKPSNQYVEPFILEGITWTSEDDSIAKVDETGVVTARGYGTTTVTATKERETLTKEIHVVDAFGYDWNKEYNRVDECFAEDPEGNIYYSILTSQGKAQLVSTKLDGSENWNVSIDERYIKHIQWVEDSLYCITSISGGHLYLTKVNPITGKEIWNFDLGLLGSAVYNIEQGLNGNVYVAEKKNFYALDKTTGEKRWSQAIDGTLYNYSLSNEGVLYMPVYNSGNTQIIKVEDEGKKGIIIESNNLDGIQLNVLNSNLIIDEEDNLYAYFSGTIDDIAGEGICAINDGNVEWVHFFDTTYYNTSDVTKLVLGKNGEIYFTSFCSNTARQMSKFVTLDKDGNLIWEKELTDLTEYGKTMYARGDFEVDVDGNIYIPMMQYASGTTASREKSILVKINPEGMVTRYLSYNMDKYGRFDYIHMSDRGIYLTGFREKYVIKLTHENTQSQVPDEILLKATKSSVVKDDYVDITATVFSQVGIAIEDEKVTWTSSRPDFAEVDDKGRVTGHAVGSTVITATSVTNPEVKASYDITVVDAGTNYITRNKLDEHIQNILKYYKKIGIDADWAAFAVSALGEDINSVDYSTNNKTYMGRLWDVISASENLGAITEYERMTLAILGGGYDPHGFGGMNLIEKIYNYKEISQGTNAVIWGLISLDAADAKVPEIAKYSQEFFVDYLLSHRAGKGWSLSSRGNPDVDITSMAIYSLAPYYHGWEDYKTAEVKTAVDEAVTWLKTKQQEKGGYNYTGANIINTESTAQVIMALTSIGIDPQGTEFARSGGNPVSAMLSNQMEDGTFMHEASIGQSDSMATYQAIQALAALKRFNEKGNSDIFYHIIPEKLVEIEPYMELISDINKLPEEITVADEETVDGLRQRYEDLSEADQEKVTNLNKLIAAETHITILNDHISPGISTNLSSKKVMDKTLSFTVKAIDNVKGEFVPEVKLNGTKISPAGNPYSYTISLIEGENTFYINAVDDNGNKTEKTYTITYKPENDEKQNADNHDDNGDNNNNNDNSSNSNSNQNTDNPSDEEKDEENYDKEATKKLRENIQEKMTNAQGGDTVSIDLQEGAQLDADMLKTLKQKENITVVLKGEGYTISFNTSDIKYIPEDFDMELVMTFTSSNEETIKELTGGDNALILHFDYHGDLPVPMTIVVELTDDLKDKDQMYLYYYNEETGEVELVEDANMVIQDGYAQFTIVHCSDYILTDTIVAGISDTEENINTANGDTTVQEETHESGVNIILAVILAAAFIAIGILAVVLYRRKKTLE